MIFVPSIGGISHSPKELTHWSDCANGTDVLLRTRVARNPNVVADEKLTLGNRVADEVARFGGSWNFIGLFGFVMLTWIIVNTILLVISHK